MTIRIEITEPLAGQVHEAAKSLSTSPERYVLDVVSKTLAHDAPLPSSSDNDGQVDPLLGLLSEDPELADFIAETALERRRTLPLRAPRE